MFFCIYQILNFPYSIGYATLDDAMTKSLNTARIINKAGYVVQASPDSVAYAVLEQGGNLNSKFQATLVDGNAQSAWPITGYVYFNIRTDSHIGTCERRKAAMRILYDFYFSSTAQSIVKRYGYAPVPNFIATLLTNTLINTAKCTDGSYALAEYMTIVMTNIGVTSFMKPLLSVYLPVYKAIDSSVTFNLDNNDQSITIWNKFVSNPTVYEGGVFTYFSSMNKKIAAYSQLRDKVLTTPFVSIPVVINYHLNAISTLSRLRFSAEILSDIFIGKIKFWNDTNIAQINPGLNLPSQRINIVVCDSDSDTNIISSRFLASKSAAFASIYNVPSDGLSKIPYRNILDINHTYFVKSDSFVNDAVTHYDGSIAFYNLMYGLPSASVAKYCTDINCINIVDPMDGGTSIQNCEKDPVALVNPYGGLNSYDFLLSQNPTCYPIAGTVDFTIRTINRTLVNIGSLRLAAWLFNGDNVVSPLTTYQATVASTNIRKNAYSAICDINIGTKAFGYSYCGYHDCTWKDGDYIQQVSECDPKTSTRTVSYLLNMSAICRNIDPPSPATFECTYVPYSSSIGGFGLFMCVFGAFISSFVLLWTYLVRYSKAIKKSQPIFVFIFILGAIFMNYTTLAYIGPNTDTSCLARPWLLNLSASIMFVPLIMKLRRVHRLVNNPRMRKIKITDSDVMKFIIVLLMVDVILLLIWTYTNTPRMIIVPTNYSGALAPVNNEICSTGLSNTMEVILLIWKTMLLCYGVYLAAITWHAPAELAEAKTFAVAIYNITVVGGLSYFLSGFLASAASYEIGFILIYLGLFFCSSVPVVLVMASKLYVAEFDPNKVLPYFIDSHSQDSHSSADSRRSSVGSMTSVAHLITGFLSTDHHTSSVDSHEHEHTPSSMYDADKFSSSFGYNTSDDISGTPTTGRTTTSNSNSIERRKDSNEHSTSESSHEHHVHFLPTIPEAIQPESTKTSIEL